MWILCCKCDWISVSNKTKWTSEAVEQELRRSHWAVCCFYNCHAVHSLSHTSLLHCLKVWQQGTFQGNVTINENGKKGGWGVTGEVCLPFSEACVLVLLLSRAQDRSCCQTQHASQSKCAAVHLAGCADIQTMVKDLKNLSLFQLYFHDDNLLYLPNHQSTMIHND